MTRVAIRRDAKNTVAIDSSDIEEENEVLRKEIDNLNNEIERRKDEEEEKNKRIEALDQELTEKAKQNNLITLKLVELKNHIAKYSLKPIPQKPEETPYTSLCEVRYDYDGNMKLHRLADISNEIILDEFDDSYPDRGQLFSKDTNEDEGTIAVWNWGKIPNIKNPEKDFILSKKRGISDTNRGDCYI